MIYKRLSPAMIKLGTKRPEVIMAQDALKAVGFDPGPSDGWAGGKTKAAIESYQIDEFGCGDPDYVPDGVIGEITWTRLLQDAEAAGYKPPLERRIHTVINFFENSTKQNSYGSISLLPDGAGVNYGVLQHNRHGSLVVLLQMAGRHDLAKLYLAHDKFKICRDIQYWMPTPDGVEAQNNYFKKRTLKTAMRIIDEMPSIREFFKQKYMLPYWERFLLMMADTVTQNGSLWSSNAKPFWRSITNEEEKYKKYRELFYGTRFNKLEIKAEGFIGGILEYEMLKRFWYSVESKVKQEVEFKSPKSIRRETNKRAMNELLERIPDPEDKLTLIAQWRARSSAAKWWSPAVESRRMLDAKGYSTVNGSPLDLEQDFGFLDDDMFKDESTFELESES